MKFVKLLQENEQGTAIYGATQFADLTGIIDLSNFSPGVSDRRFHLCFPYPTHV